MTVLLALNYVRVSHLTPYYYSPHATQYYLSLERMVCGHEFRFRIISAETLVLKAALYILAGETKSRSLLDVLANYFKIVLFSLLSLSLLICPKPCYFRPA